MNAKRLVVFIFITLIYSRQVYASNLGFILLQILGGLARGAPGTGVPRVTYQATSMEREILDNRLPLSIRNLCEKQVSLKLPVGKIEEIFRNPDEVDNQKYLSFLKEQYSGNSVKILGTNSNYTEIGIFDCYQIRPKPQVDIEIRREIIKEEKSLVQIVQQQGQLSSCEYIAQVHHDNYYFPFIGRYFFWNDMEDKILDKTLQVRGNTILYRYNKYGFISSYSLADVYHCKEYL